MSVTPNAELNRNIDQQFEQADLQFEYSKKPGRNNEERSTNYKRYTLRDYRNSDQMNYKMGGLGANVGGDEWQKAKSK